MSKEPLQSPTLDAEQENLDAKAFPFDTTPFSAIQLKAIVALAEFPPTFKSYQDLADQLEIHRTTLFEWRNRDDFKKALSKMADWFFLNTGHLVRQGHLAACQKGNPQAIKLYYQKAENWVERTKVEHQGELTTRHFKIRRVDPSSRAENGDNLTSEAEPAKKADPTAGPTEAEALPEA